MTPDKKGGVPSIITKRFIGSSQGVTYENKRYWHMLDNKSDMRFILERSRLSTDSKKFMILSARVRVEAVFAHQPGTPISIDMTKEKKLLKALTPPVTPEIKETQDGVSLMKTITPFTPRRSSAHDTPHLPTHRCHHNHKPSDAQCLRIIEHELNIRKN